MGVGGMGWCWAWFGRAGDGRARTAYFPMHGISAVLLAHHGGCSHDGVLSGVALGSHSKWCSVIMAVRDPAQTALSCSKVGMPSAMEEFFQAYYIIAIHLHIVFLQVIAFAWVCLKADSQEQMIVHKRKLCICHLPWGLLSGCTVWGCPRLSWLHVLSNAWHLSSTIGPSWRLLS